MSPLGDVGQGDRSTGFKQPVRDWEQVVTRRGWGGGGGLHSECLTNMLLSFNMQ